ncbi:mannosyltransferase putative-domain-containing protein [Gongronella butleri]|nr:mannosyltransferase putative-domain-containing protein [Gongronella butleri]
MTTQLRLFKMLYQYIDPLLAAEINVQQNASHQEAWSLYTKLETQLFPWLSPTWKSAFDINGKYDEARPRGIVMCVGNGQYHYALRAITAVRRTLKSKLPIEIFAIDDGDLSPAKREVLREFENVRIFNVMDIVGKEGTEFGGWALKPYAMVASSFKEVILMDADVYFLRAPETVFDDEGYKATGALFFYDRTLFGDWRIGRDWLSSFLPSMSSLVKHTRWWRLQSAHEQESGIVVIDKSRALLGLMATCKMNGKRERDEVSYKRMHGDKESFWVGFEMMQTPYAFVKSHAAVLGALGDAGDDNTVCGNIMHLDAQGKPYWWNGAIYRDKNRWHDRYMKFESYAIGESWEFETSCIKETDQIHTLSDEFKKIGQQYIKNDQDLKDFDGVD